MKVEIASMLNYENRNCVYASAMKIETVSMLSYENRNLRVCLRMKIGNCK